MTKSRHLYEAADFNSSARYLNRTRLNARLPVVCVFALLCVRARRAPGVVYDEIATNIIGRRVGAKR